MVQDNEILHDAGNVSKQPNLELVPYINNEFVDALEPILDKVLDGREGEIDAPPQVEYIAEGMDLAFTASAMDLLSHGVVCIHQDSRRKSQRDMPDLGTFSTRTYVC